jgi:hypothetical protein
MAKKIYSLYLDPRLLEGVPDGERSSWVTLALCKLGLDYIEYQEKHGRR